MSSPSTSSHPTSQEANLPSSPRHPALPKSSIVSSWPPTARTNIHPSIHPYHYNSINSSLSTKPTTTALTPPTNAIRECKHTITSTKITHHQISSPRIDSPPIYRCRRQSPVRPANQATNGPSRRSLLDPVAMAPGRVNVLMAARTLKFNDTSTSLAFAIDKTLPFIHSPWRIWEVCVFGAMIPTPRDKYICLYRLSFTQILYVCTCGMKKLNYQINPPIDLPSIPIPT